MLLESLLTSVTVACNEQVKTQVNDLVVHGVSTLVTLFSPPTEEALTPTPDSQDKATISRLEEEVKLLRDELRYTRYLTTGTAIAICICFYLKK